VIFLLLEQVEAAAVMVEAEAVQEAYYTFKVSRYLLEIIQ
tara:strand:- start:713 stop:832 length:120 start_codon:yes stop_codon:yes gene_type:complete